MTRLTPLGRGLIGGTILVGALMLRLPDAYAAPLLPFVLVLGAMLGFGWRRGMLTEDS